MAFLPVWCFNCRRFISRPLRSPSFFLCSNCYEALPFIDFRTCDHCGLDHATGLCPESWAGQIDAFSTLFYYRDPVHRWIINHKYSGGFFSGRVLRGFIDAWFRSHEEEVREYDAVLPVPIHPRRLRQRGFNQTSFLTKNQGILPVRCNWLKKVRHTVQQAGLKEQERGANIRGAFAAAPDVAGMNLLVFDDVCTTGQTLGEVASSLKRAGANRIHVLVLSRRVDGYS